MITLVLGGARSGKSAVAERLALSAGDRAAATGGDPIAAGHPSATPVTYIATMVVGGDGDLASRVDAHRERRPVTWHTVEIGPPGSGPTLADTLRTAPGPVLLDSLSPWLALHPDFAVDSADLCAALVGRTADTIVVSDEVGLSLHPPTRVGSLFRDALGALNQAVASAADRVLLVVAGRVLTLDPAPEV